MANIEEKFWCLGRGIFGRYRRRNNYKKKSKKPKEKTKKVDEKTLREQVTQEGSDDEDLAVAETYADYMPSKLKVGKRHPDPVVETASLSSVAPPDIDYELHLPSHVVESGALSALQLEAITYAAQQHQHFLPDGSRAGFLIGDGAGVGKGRTVAGCIFENYLQGRKKAIWISVSADLKYDSERDLDDIGATNIKVYALSKLKYDKLSSAANGWIEEGVIFCTYSLLSSSSTLGGRHKTRMEQLLDWCGDNFDGVIVFDESHKAKNLVVTKAKPTKAAQAVVELQSRLPLARVVYASATGASEPRNMAYMTRLGIWGTGTPFPDFMDFINSVEKRGVGAMEIVAMDMKLRGIYIARQLSFHGVTFNIDEIQLSPEFVRAYNDSVALWVQMLNDFQTAIELMEVPAKDKMTIIRQFWGSHQRFFKYLCIAAKVERTVAITREAVKMGKSVVIGLQSTGEAATIGTLKEDGEINEFVGTAKTVLQQLVEKHFPAPDRNKVNKLLGIKGLGITNGNYNGVGKKRKLTVRQTAIVAAKKVKMEKKKESSSESEKSEGSDSESSFSFSNSDSDSSTSEHSASTDVEESQKNKGNMTATDKACAMREQLLDKIEHLGKRLPPNTLDQLIDELGGPENVAEMTGRKGRVVQGSDGSIHYESRGESECSLETLNLTEKSRFMDGQKVIAIISEAASSGISLQSDRRVTNQRRRVHITLELPWSADRAIQQFGRTHRSNQVNAPEYMFLISNLAGERRFASIVAKRLESLGALTHGDRRATEVRDLSQYNIDTKYGRTALTSVMNAVLNKVAPLVPPPQDYKGDFFKDCTDALVGVGVILKSMNGFHTMEREINISRFLNRILGLPVELQNRLFQYFMDTLQAIVNQAKKSGRYDLGILDLGTAGDNVHHVELHTFLGQHATGSAMTEIHVVRVERGFSWEDAMRKAEQLTGDDEGFYLSHQIRNGKQTAILAVSPNNRNTGSKFEMYTIYRPNTGLQVRPDALGEIKKKYRKVKASDAMKHWIQQYESSLTTCSHAYWGGNCRMVTLGYNCEVGLRRRKYNVLAGSVLSVWTKVEAILREENRTQVVRLRTADGVKIVGTLIPNSCLGPLLQELE
ncbi:protein strawberry notch-like [Macrosteles quadrilineatus]|uniref:protein strawberry notch-like n=1 Tax=Macrosteles quadrilineatus TaxID=74068 RepID=UPI0023E2DC4E|nr:protein strawberry notch-like [Macrosteles quadrilineatus]